MFDPKIINYLADYLQYPKSLERIGVCSTCSSFIKETIQCSECGCLMKAKVLIPTAKCPQNKW